MASQDLVSVVNIRLMPVVHPTFTPSNKYCPMRVGLVELGNEMLRLLRVCLVAALWAVHRKVDQQRAGSCKKTRDGRIYHKVHFVSFQLWHCGYFDVR